MNKKTSFHLKYFILTALMIIISFASAANDIELLTVTDYNQGSLIRLSKNTILAIELDAAVAAGYNWYQADDRSRNFLSQIGEPLNKESRSSLLGQTTTVQIFFQAEARGYGILSLELKRIWETGEAPVKTFSIRVQADAPFSGSFNPPVGAAIEMTEEQLSSTNDRALPSQFNWCGTSFNQCPPCKNQGNTNACWSFCTTAAFECALGNTTAKYSEQFLINCNKDGYTAANGGYPVSKYHCDTLAKTQTQAGAVNSTTVPWTGSDGTCSGPYATVKKLNSYGKLVQSGVPTVDQIKQALYDHGPVACGVYADSKMQSYTGGVFSASSGQANHCVLLVGWNDADGAWYMRNSWGTSWGENGGYMRIKWGTGSIGSLSEYVDAGSQSDCQAAFTVSTSPNNNTAVFTDSSSCTQGSITGWNWNFGDNSTSTAKSPTHTYSSAGSYTVTLTVRDSASQTYSTTKTVTVPTSMDYCASASTNYSAFYISNVKLGTLNNSSQGSTYTDFTNVNAPQLQIGQNYTLTITITTAQYTNWFKAYIDYNRDGDFDDAGEVIYVIPQAQKVASAGGTITIPTTATPGLTRMRVQVKNIGTTQLPAPQPCETFTYGEVEDYTVNIIQSNTNNPPTANFTYTTTQLTATFTDTSTDAEGAIKSWAWKFGDGSTSTLKSPSRTYSSAGTYNVTLTVTDQGNLTNSISKAVTVSIANTSPTANFTYTTIQLTATFTDTSTDAEGAIKSWAWNFGDGSTSTLKSPSRTYSSAGSYNVTLTVTDQGNLTNSITKTVTVSDTSNNSKDDFIGYFSDTATKGIWKRESGTGNWTKLSDLVPNDIAMGDINGDGIDDFVGSFSNGVWWMNSVDNKWTQLNKDKATNISCGDIDGDGLDDLMGVWPNIAGTWVRYTSSATWEKISNSKAILVTAGKTR